MRLAPPIVALVLALVAHAAPPAAGVPHDLSSAPLDRGALLALPSVYRVEVTVRLDALRTEGGRRVDLPPDARRIVESGTAAGVAPGGWIVTAGHVAVPRPETVARRAHLVKRAVEGEPHSREASRDWVERTGATPVGMRVVERRVRQADAGAGPGGSRAYRPERVRPSGAADLALLRIPAAAAPALELDEAMSLGTPVVAIGFGSEGMLGRSPADGLEPSLREGLIGRSGTLEDPERTALVVTSDILPGDSGGPVVDGAGRLRGVVVARTDRGGIVETAGRVRRLLERAGVAPGPGRSGRLFREAMDRFWTLDFAAAERRLAAAREAFPDHALAGRQERRAQSLAAAEAALSGADRRRRLLVAVAALAGVGALACGAGLLRSARRGGPPGGAERAGTRVQ